MTVTTRRRQSSASDGSRDGRFARVDLVARDTIKPFIASAVVATWQMRWYGHVAHGISRLYHSGYRSLRDITYTYVTNRTHYSIGSSMSSSLTSYGI